MPSKAELLLAMLDDVIIGVVILIAVLAGLVAYGFMNLVLAILIGIAVSFFLIIFTYKIMKPQLLKPKIGTEAMIGKIGKAITDVKPEGLVLIDGEYWTAFSKIPIEKGDGVEVVMTKGLRIEVRKQRRLIENN